MRKFVCTICGYVYDEEKGNPQGGVAPGTRWEDLPDTWVCPLCGAAKSDFRPADAPPKPAPKPLRRREAADMLRLSPLEASALCSNLARGCEKQYLAEEAALFTQLADFFETASAPAKAPDWAGIADLVEQDLAQTLPAASSAASQAGDRGALRALVWSEKVTRIHKSLLTRYRQEGEAMLKNTGVYVCTICGFIYVGDNPPALCPVCKVPGWKFDQIEGRAQ